MLAQLLPYLNTINWTDETILKAVKDLQWGNIILDEFDQVVTAYERVFKLRALAEKEDDD